MMELIVKLYTDTGAGSNPNHVTTLDGFIDLDIAFYYTTILKTSCLLSDSSCSRAESQLPTKSKSTRGLSDTSSGTCTIAAKASKHAIIARGKYLVSKETCRGKSFQKSRVRACASDGPRLVMD